MREKMQRERRDTPIASRIPFISNLSNKHITLSINVTKRKANADLCIFVNSYLPTTAVPLALAISGNYLQRCATDIQSFHGIHAAICVADERLEP